MRLLLSVCAIALVGISGFCQQPKASQPPIPPVIGVIQSFDGKIVTIKLSDGSSGTATLAANAIIFRTEKRTLADIRPGDFIASGGTRGPDGKIHANEIRIFTGAMGEGQYPMAKPDQVMTNATVTEVMTDATVKQVGNNNGTPVIKLTFHGAGAPGTDNCTGRAADAPGGAGKGCVGETEFEVPPDTPVIAVIFGDISMLKPGTKATLNMTEAQDGTFIANWIMVTE